LLKLYKDSTTKILLDTFPEHPWRLSRFAVARPGYISFLKARAACGDPHAWEEIKERMGTECDGSRSEWLHGNTFSRIALPQHQSKNTINQELVQRIVHQLIPPSQLTS